MEWRGRRGSSNIDDRRGMTAGGVGGLGLVGTLVVLAVGWFFGVDISPLVSGMQEDVPVSGGQRDLTAAEREAGQFVSAVLGSTEEVWNQVLPDQAGTAYREPVLVLYAGVVQSACGSGSSAMGPFYCPGDHRVYLDTSFFAQMRDRMGAGGDFAYSYVIAHEVGHHVQNLLGILPQVNQLRARASRGDSNYLSVLTELQADCFAGIWGRQAVHSLAITREDLEEAMTAAAAVGDDVLMESAGRTPVPDSFTHGSAADRQDWFGRGFQSGELARCNTFGEAGL
ncbi:hypothetical protein GI374_12880 [Paracoccus sp. S-4012]|uniref:KPN_02809 family neutral zinc metallopeptidase n=1 Tax=Paracoccus sp. S-4012 TaxID=2665648 RepID=UPI0012AFB7C6|nr:neutral zinc metallopeptidase [Paracoccus sp. S-4012]MRX51322.1 hypothetical protein [Paracoccus sp. S-4012]